MLGKLLSQSAQYGPHWAGAGLDKFQRQCDKLIIAFRNSVKYQILQNAQIQPAQTLVAIQRLTIYRIHAGGIDTDQAYPQRGQPVKQFGA